ncbi:Helix-turn-helix domain-containing protein [Halogranum rubrum]|uniref:Helix-turn-helix domain-containing protein n=1 Tax=Halogranum rubrum TaxID=553466 RepID=A0A1I4F737_9EURY|nr:helix-turn-helix domain-containing protein [Halogranum rubrum]SFL12657.1 Helix-turn-helix domain-containing protein [Halogranum rubrum]
MRNSPALTLLVGVFVFASAIPMVAAATHSPVYQPITTEMATVTGDEVLAEVASATASSASAVDPTPLLVVAGYARHDFSPLDNEVRNEVFRAITDSPGAYVAAVADETDIPRSTVRYHVRVLEREGLVFSEKIRGKQRHFPSDDDHPTLTAALADDTVATVMSAVAQTEPATTSELAAELDRAPSTVSHHLSRLEEDELVERERDGGAVLTRISPEISHRLHATLLELSHVRLSDED